MLFLSLFIIITFQISAFAFLEEKPDPLITLPYGTFQGKTSNGLHKFLGMPFAAPPLRSLRFQPPQPPLKFRGIKEAKNHGPGCMQKLFRLTAGFSSTISEVR